MYGLYGTGNVFLTDLEVGNSKVEAFVSSASYKDLVSASKMAPVTVHGPGRKDSVSSHGKKQKSKQSELSLLSLS